jgi:hypothetical protein
LLRERVKVDGEGYFACMIRLRKEKISRRFRIGIHAGWAR